MIDYSSHTGSLVGTLPTEQHRVSGQVYIVDSKTIFIEDFNYDGGGPGQSGGGGSCKMYSCDIIVSYYFTIISVW